MNAFPLRDNCPVPIVEAIEGSLVEDCVVVEAPPACPETPIILFPPPSFNFGCYAPGLTIKSKVVTSTSPKFLGGISYPNKYETGNCQPIFNFDVQFACESPKVSAKIVSYVSPIFKATVNQSSTASDTCSPDFDFEIGFPCTYPKIKDGIFQWKAPGEDPSEIKLRLIISLVGSSISSQVCDWALRSEVFPVCPKFDPGAITAEWDSDGDTPLVNVFEIVFNDGGFVPEDHCPYVYNIDIKVPALKTVLEDDQNLGTAECCEDVRVVVRHFDGANLFPYLEPIDNHKIKLHYAWKTMTAFQVEAGTTAADEEETQYLKNGAVTAINDLSATNDSECGTCDNKVVGAKIDIDTGGVDCDVTYVCYISTDRFGAVTAHYAIMHFLNGIFTGVERDVSDPGACTASCDS